MLCASFALQCMALTPVVVNAAQAQTSTEQKSFKIPAGPVGAAITRFSGEAGVVVSFDANLAAGRNTSGLNGVYSIEQGFAVLLKGSGLHAQKIDERTYLVSRLEQDGPMNLGPVRVDGQEMGGPTEGTGSYTTGVTNTATKLNLSLRETPQSVSVMTRQRIDDQNLSSIGSVLEQTPGINVQSPGSDRLYVFSRGLAVDNYQYDGLPTTSFAFSQALPPAL